MLTKTGIKTILIHYCFHLDLYTYLHPYVPYKHDHIEIGPGDVTICNAICFHMRLRAGVAAGLAEMELVCLRGQRVLSQLEWHQFEMAYLLFRAALDKMGSCAMSRKQTRWRQRPKGHALEHLCYDFHRKNPRYMSNYLDEDFVRRTKRLALISHPKFVSKHVVFRYAVAATLRWTGMQPE